MNLNLSRRATFAALAGAGAIAALPLSRAVAQPASASAAAPAQDRDAIRAMAGDYNVRFDFRETVSYQADYTPIDPKLSGGYESVRVIEDRPDFISLQHLLVVEHEGEVYVIKHWREDWRYEPSAVLAYTRVNRWDVRTVSAEERAGAWAQTVYQTDDSPRYGGVGRWTHAHGASRWTSGQTLRPLARRDAVRHPPYNRYSAINTHAITPAGWVHEQVNTKLGERDGQSVVFVDEFGLNTYRRFNEYPVAEADRYWAATSGYWAEVRAAWANAVARGNGVSVEEEPENGSITGPRLMGLADEILSGARASAPAIVEARSVIETATRAA